MRFRANLFTILAILSLLFIIYGLSVSGGAFSTVVSTPVPAASADARTAGAAIGAGISATVFLCLGAPFLLFFSLLAWRNRVGIRTEQRHQEQLSALRDAKN